MALINRVSRLFKADFHAVLDQIEEPELMLRQAVRDMEDELSALEERMAEGERERAAMASRRDEMRSKAAELDEQLDLCFRSGKDDLARSQIRRKLEAERIARHLDARIASADGLLREQRSQAEENRLALESLRQKAEVFAERSPSPGRPADFDDAAWLAREMSVSDDEVEIAFLREQQRRADA